MPKNTAKVQFTADCKQFNAQINEASATMKKLGAELKLNETQMKANGISVEGLQKKHELLSAELEAARSKTEALNGKLESAVRNFGENSVEAERWRAALITAQTAEAKLQIEINACNAELKKQEDALKEQEDAAEQTVKANKKLSDVIEKQKSDLAELKKAYANAVAEYGKGSKEAKELAQQISKLSGELEDNENKFEKAEEKADKLDKTLDDVDDSADKAGTSLVKIGGGIAKTVVAGFAAITAAGAAMVGTFLGMAESTREYREEQGKLDAAFSASDLSAQSADNTYRSLFRAIGESDQSVEAAQQIALLAESEQDAAKWAGLATGVIGTFGDALQPETFYESANETLKLGEATGAYTQMLEGCGMSVEDFNAGLAACATEEEKQEYMLRVTEEALGDAGAAYEKANADILAANEANAKLAESTAKIGAAAEPVRTTMTLMGADILNSIAPSVTLIGEGLIGALNGAEGASQTLAYGLSGVLPAIVRQIPEAMPSVVNVISELFPALLRTLSASAPTLIKSLATLAVNLISGLSQQLPMLTSSLLTVVLELVTTICQALPTLIPQLVSGITGMIVVLCEMLPQIIQPILDNLPTIIISLVSALVENLPALIDGIITLVLGIVEATPQIVQGLVDAIPTIVEMLVTSLLQNTWRIIVGIGQVIVALAKALPSLWTSFKQSFLNIFIGIWNAVKDVFAPVGEWFREKFELAKEAVSNAWSSVTGFFGDIWSGIKNTFASVGSWFKNIFTTAKNGISNAFSSVKNIFSDVWSSIKNTFSNVGGWFKKKFQTVKNNIMNIWSGIKLKLPDIKLPHFSVSGKFSLNPISVPKLSIKWYKEGGIMTEPTIFGALGSTLLGGGEAGAEAILPIDKLEGYVENAVQRTMGMVNLEALADRLEDLANRPIELNINGRQFALATASAGDSVNGLRSSFKARGLAVD